MTATQPHRAVRSAIRSATLCALGLLSAGTGLAAPTWITIGERAHAVLQRTALQARTLATRAVPVTVPAARRSSRLVDTTETVHAVEIDDQMIESLSQAVHENLRICGGFVRHDSMAEALAVLDRLQSTPVPALAPSYAIDNPQLVQELMPRLQAANILATIDYLSSFQNRRYNSTSGRLSSDGLYARWQSLALTTRVAVVNGARAPLRVRQITHSWGQKSVEFEFIGSGNATETIVLGAHLDSTASGPTETVRAPGADDDASGVAGLTEIIRVLVAHNYRPQRNIRFIAYAAEEVGLLGSKAVVTALNERPDRVVGVMQLDMTAYQGDPQDLWIYTDYTNAAQNAFVANLAAAYLPQLTVAYDACGYGCSDHASWHNAGYVASFPFEASFANDNFRIHTPNDTIAGFGGTADHALKFTQLALAWVLELASDAAPARPTGSSGGSSDRSSDRSSDGSSRAQVAGRR
ncbi:MAG: M20/M25/M40 family metallo-hydrolase [Rubrivivax sp.]